MTLALALITVCASAQSKGDWYVGTGDVDNVAWTEWSVSPTVGYGVTSNLMVGLSASQADSTADLNLDFHARYYWGGYFAYVATDGLSTDGLKYGIGKMFYLKDWLYVDPKVVYNSTEKTTNLSLGFGLKF